MDCVSGSNNNKQHEGCRHHPWEQTWVAREFINMKKSQLHCQTWQQNGSHHWGLKGGHVGNMGLSCWSEKQMLDILHTNSLIKT